MVFGNDVFGGDGSERLKYILAAFVVPKSRLEPVFWTLLKVVILLTPILLREMHILYPKQDVKDILSMSQNIRTGQLFAL